MNKSLACYISGKGMSASHLTWDFKVEIIRFLEHSGMGYDTRFRYYQPHFPDLDVAELARKICDPIENYDPDWHDGQPETLEQWMQVTKYMMEKDAMFRDQAELAVYCFDEAGFGSAINNIRFLENKKQVLGFVHRHFIRTQRLNISNFLQLKIKYGEYFLLYPYDTLNDCIVILKEYILAHRQ